eukprot:2252177-Rhodomonas_salina.1
MSSTEVVRWDAAYETLVILMLRMRMIGSADGVDATQSTTYLSETHTDDDDDDDGDDDDDDDDDDDWHWDAAHAAHETLMILMMMMLSMGVGSGAWVDAPHAAP